ncbi:MAG TPA: ABC transporter substrate-binding protein [Gaiellaceae bacterium]|nr:ABC transporter substrate-binding protein [Gaiellaceae bacterium]
MREERKVVTALFADLVGSTALAERLDPEDVKLIIGEAVAHIVHAVEEYGGTVKDLAGDGVLALFGAPAAHEDDPERAVRAGLRITQEIAGYGREVADGWGVEGIAVRVGVNTGPVVLGALGAGERVEYAAFGDTVNTAARLQGAADPGTVVVGAETKRLLESIFAWSDERRLELKGKSESVTAFEAHGERRDGAGRMAGHQTRLVGRERELEQAVGAVEAALEGRGSVLIVSGEPGIGKSRLVAEVGERVRSGQPAAGTPLWLEGRCVSYGESLPYWPFRDLVRRWLGVSYDEAELRVRVALRRATAELFGDRLLEIYPYLGSLLDLSLEPEAQARLAELSPEALQYRTFEVVAQLFSRHAEDGPVFVLLEDLHWADATSLQLVERLLPLVDESALMLLLTQRPERDHPSWSVRELAVREFPHRTTEVQLEGLSGSAGGELLDALVGRDSLPEELRTRILDSAEGNPFFLEELVRSLEDAGAIVREGEGWRFDRQRDVELPPTVEQVIVARIDRLPAGARQVLVAASVLGRHFGLPLLEGVSGGDGSTRQALHELERLDLVREERRWPQPEYRFKHALIQEGAYRGLVTSERTRLHRRAAEWLEQRHAGGEEEVYGLLAHHWLAARDEEKAIEYLLRAGDKARQEYALDEAVEHYRALLPLLEERGREQEAALVLFKLALALHTSLRFEQANGAYERAFALWTPPEPASSPTAQLRITTSFLPNDPDPKSAIAWPNIQLCMQVFDRLVEAWPERTLVPSLAERWEIAPDGLHYVFHLRDGLRWSDGEPLTAHDLEFGIKRVLDPSSPGSSVAIYFVLENGQDYYLGHNRDADRIGVRALDDRTVEFRLVAPAPYFMSVMNRPDGAPQPRHAIERDGASWTEPERQVVSGPFAVSERTENALVLRRRPDYAGFRSGNVDEVRMTRSAIADALPLYARDEVDLILVRYTPRLADLMPDSTHFSEAALGPAAWSAYLRFDHTDSAMSNVDLRRALAHAIDREALAAACPANLAVATGGVVPPALQGHTPDIAPRYDPDLARELLARSGFSGQFELGGMLVWEAIIAAVAESWEQVFGSTVSVRTWSWRDEEAMEASGRIDAAVLRVTGWFPGYPDPEYYLRLLFQSDSRTNEGGFSHPPFDELIERARRERDDRTRLELYHEADRMAVADQVACIPLVYGRNVAYVKPRVHGWWEFGKSSASFADLQVVE